MSNFRKISKFANNEKNLIKQVSKIVDFFRQHNITTDIQNYSVNGVMNRDLFLKAYNDKIESEKKVLQKAKRQTKKENIKRESMQNAIESNKRQFELLKTVEERKKRSFEKSKFKNILKEIKTKGEAKRKIASFIQNKFNKKIRQQVKLLPNNDISTLRQFLKIYTGETIMVEYVIDGKIIRSIEYDVPSNFSGWWRSISLRDWFINSETSLFEEHENRGTVFIYKTNTNLNTKKIIQAFRDGGITHCVFTPIRIWAIEKETTSKTEKTKYRYSGMIKKINKLETKYKNGVPENAIAEICNELQIDISIELPFSETKFIDAQSIKKRLKQFRYMNTRLNHIDLNEIVNNDEYTEVSRSELFQIKNMLDDTNKFYTYKKDRTSINLISTLTKQYKLINPMTEIINEFELDTGLNFCKIDDIDDYELSQFIREGTNYNATVDFKKYSKVHKPYMKHIDMKKAYANFKSCVFYEGFLGKITDFRKCNKIMGVGMYKITNIIFQDNTFKKYNDKLKIYINNNVYTSSELNMLSSYGVLFNIVCGCWGVKPIHFEFSEEMLNSKDEEGASYYAKWTGMCDMHHLEKKFWLNGDSSYFDVIRNECGNGVVRWYENNSGCIAFKKKHNYHLGHITAFITAYQRMNVIEQLMEIDYDKVFRVCVDGIYHIQNDVILKNVFCIKEQLKFGNEASDSYVSSATEKPLYICEANEREHFHKELHIGEGGCGKTHFNCNDTGLIKVLFLAPSWKLARCKKNETGINCSVWARALTNDPEKINAIKQIANTLLCDETSMMSEGGKQYIFDTFPDMKIIMCGDLGFQLPCIDGEEMTTEGFDNIVKHKTDYRCKDLRLREIKKCLRLMISHDKTKKEINNWVIDEFKRLGQCINIEQLKNLYKIDDMILCGTNELKDFYTNIFTGKFDTEKYYIVENNRLHSNGEILIGEKPQNTKCEIRHSFTTHSIQGETAENNLFIDSCKMFDSRMFYTAISRARKLKQIYIIIKE